MPEHLFSGSQPAYLDIDQQQWTGRQIFLADVRFDSGVISPKVAGPLEFHDPNDATSQVFLEPLAYPGANTQVQVILPAFGTVPSVGGANNWTADNQWSGSAAAIRMFSKDGARLVLLGDSSAGASLLAEIYDSNLNQTIKLHDPTAGIGADRDQYFQDVDGYFAMLPIAGGTPVVGNGTDPPASGAIGKVARTAQSAAIAATNLTDSTPAGFYRVSYSLLDTSSDVTAGTLSFGISYTDEIGATTQTSATINLALANQRQRGEFLLYLASGNIQYVTTLVGIIGSSRYALHVRCEYLG